MTRKMGVDIVARAIQAPVRRIAENAELTALSL